VTIVSWMYSNGHCAIYTCLFVFLQKREWFMTDLFYFTEYCL